MTLMLEPGGFARRVLLRRVLGVGVVALINTRSGRAAADAGEVLIDSFTFSPTPPTVKSDATVTWVNRDDIHHSIVCPDLKMQSHPMDSDDAFSYRFEKIGTCSATIWMRIRTASAYARAGGGFRLNSAIAVVCGECSELTIGRALGDKTGNLSSSSRASVPTQRPNADRSREWACLTVQNSPSVPQ
jgi:plastocyanin